MKKNILPFFRVRHIPRWWLHLSFRICQNLIYINIFIRLYIGFINNIGNLFSCELFILCCFCNVALVRVRADIESKILFSLISFSYFFINILKWAHITICLILLILIIYNKINLINKYKNKSNKYVTKLTIHRRNLLSLFVSLQYP